MSEMGQNSLPGEWLSQNSNIRQVKIPNLNKDNNDKVRWQSNEKNLVKFSVNKAWKDLSKNHEKVAWYNVVWFSNMISRHAFIIWLLMHSRLPTQARISKWYPNRTKGKCQIKERSNEWKRILEELIKFSNKRNIGIIIKKITYAACEYLIWHERNSRLFQGVKKKWKEIWSIIK
nr:hypothetical protein [Tanacetum cinerariifolium]